MFLTRSDGEVYEKGDGTLCDAYSMWHASNNVHFWTWYFSPQVAVNLTRRARGHLVYRGPDASNYVQIWTYRVKRSPSIEKSKKIIMKIRKVITINFYSAKPPSFQEFVNLFQNTLTSVCTCDTPYHRLFLQLFKVELRSF